MSAKLARCMRILTLVPWLQSVENATFGELSKRFDYKPKELLRDLMTLTLVGIPPYSPGDLAVVRFDPEEEVYEAYEKKKSPKSNWRVSMTEQDFFAFPPQLTPRENLILITAYSLIQDLGLELDGTMTQALEKVRNSIQASSKIETSVSHNALDPELLSKINSAIQEEQQLELYYHSLREAKRDYYTIEPWQVYFANNSWYLDAYCHQTQAKRVFRISRIQEIKESRSSFTQNKPDSIDQQTHNAYIPNLDDPKVTLELEAEGRWALDLLVAEQIDELQDNKIRIRLSIGSQTFLEKLLLQIGKDGKIVDGDFEKELCSKAAKRLLKKYEN